MKLRDFLVEIFGDSEIDLYSEVCFQDANDPEAPLVPLAISSGTTRQNLVLSDTNVLKLNAQEDKP